jgi:hypothetical protein
MLQEALVVRMEEMGASNINSTPHLPLRNLCGRWCDIPISLAMKKNLDEPKRAD